MIDAASLAGVKQRYAALSPRLDERRRRLMVAAEAVALGPRSVAAVERVTGVARSTIIRGIRELREPEPIVETRVRRPGAGRKRAVDKDPTLLADLEALVEPGSRGDPESALRWTSKSLRRLAAELNEMGHQIGPSLVHRLLRQLGYSLQANRKTLASDDDPTGPRRRLTWRLRVTFDPNCEQHQVVEQVAFVDVGVQGIDQIDLLCSGFQPDGTLDEHPVVVYDAGDRGCADGLAQEFRQQIDALPLGATLVSVVRDPAAKADLPPLARMLGHAVRSVESEPGGVVRITVEKMR